MSAYDKIKDRGRYASEEEEMESIEEESTITSTASNQDQSAYEEDYKNEENYAAYDEQEDEILNDESTIDTEEIAKDLKEEIKQLLNFAGNHGKKVPESVSENLYTRKLSVLFNIHGELSELVAPATPKTIRYITSFRKDGKKSFFTAVPLMRNLIIAAIISIIALIGSGLSEEVSTERLNKGILEDHGIALLLNLIFLCSASAIGSTFFLLSKLLKEIKLAILSQEDSLHYWARLIMGILSGLILSEILVVDQGTDIDSVEINRLLFALLGGFASEMVYSILEQLMEKIQVLIVGNN